MRQVPVKNGILHQVLPDTGELYDIRHSISFPEAAVIIRMNVVNVEFLLQAAHKGAEVIGRLVDTMYLHRQGVKPLLIPENIIQDLVLVAFDIDFQKYIPLLALHGLSGYHPGS